MTSRQQSQNFIVYPLTGVEKLPHLRVFSSGTVLFDSFLVRLAFCSLKSLFGCLVLARHRPFCRTWHTSPFYEAATPRFRMRTRLYAAAVRLKYQSTFSTPLYRVLRRLPMVLIQPNVSSIRFRILRLTLYPSCLVVRPSMADDLLVLFWATCGVALCSRRVWTKSLVS